MAESALSLLFRIKADSKDAVSDVNKLRRTLTDDFKGIEQGGSQSFAKLGNSVGLSTSQMAGLAKAAPLVGTAIVGAFTVAIGAAVALGAGLFALAKQSADFGSEIFDASQKVTLGAETLSAMKVAAEQSNSSLSEFTQGFVRFERALVSAANGNKKLSATFLQVGIDAKTAMTDPEAAFRTFIANFNRLEDSTKKTTITTELYGKAGANLKSTFNTIGASLDTYIEKQRALGLLLSDESAAAADEFGDALKELSLVSDGVGRQFAGEFMPAITGAMEDIQSALVGNQETWREWGKTTANVIRGLRAEWRTMMQLLEMGLTNPATALLVAGDLFRANKAAIEEEDRNRDLSSLGARASDRRGRAGVGGDTEDAEKRANAIAQIEAKLAATRLQVVKQNYERQKFEAEQFYDNDEKNYTEYIRRLVQAEQTRYQETIQLRQALLDAEVAAIKSDDPSVREKERQAIVAIGLNEGQQLRLDHERTLEAINDQSHKRAVDTSKVHNDEKIQIYVRHLERMNELQAVYDERQIAILKEGIDSKLIAESQGLERIQKIRNEALKREEDINLARLQHHLKTSESSSTILAGIAQAEIQRLQALESPRKEEREKLQLLLDLLYDIAVAEGKRATAAETAADRITEARHREAFPEGPVPGGLPGDPNAPIIPLDQLNIPPPAMDPWLKAFAELKQVGLGAVQSLASGIGNLVQNFVLLGNAGGGSMKKLVAGVLASVAAQAATLAVMELAYGIAALTPWGAAIYGPAPFHFKAAAMFAAVAAISGLAGRAVAGTSFAAQGAGGGAGGTSGGGSSRTAGETPETRMIEQNRNQGNRQDIYLHVIGNDAFVTKAVLRNVESNGELRQTFALKTEL